MMTYDKMLVKSVIEIKVLNKSTSKSFQLVDVLEFICREIIYLKFFKKIAVRLLLQCSSSA